MKINNLIFPIVALLITAAVGCQKMDRPELGDYPKDTPVTPTTSLRFFLPFDSTSPDDKQINIRFKDSISGYPSFFPNSSISIVPGVKGTAFQGTSSTVLKYINTNDFVATAQSFTVAFWAKRNGRPEGDAQFAFAIPSSNGHWAGTTMMLLFDHGGAGATNANAVLKFVVVDKNMADVWFEWAGDNNKVPGIQDNNWHHLAFVYDATTSGMTLYVDGVKHPHVPKWGTHGAANMDASKVTGFNLGGRPKEDLGWGKSWDGGLDQFRLYNAALSAAEIKALFDSKM